jgi:anti-sigma factor RsiW
MTPASNTSDLTARQMADLSALADGTLDPARRPEVEAWIASSPDLRALYERERQAVDALHRARATDRAPAGLRARIEAERPSSAVRTRRRLTYGAAFAGAIAAVALAIVLILPSGTPGAPSVSQAAALALRGPAFAAPVPDPRAPNARLKQDVQEVYFPNWTHSFGWTAVGQRVDRINGRIAMTVYYRGPRGHLVAYTIVQAPALKQPAASISTVHGTVLRTLKLDGRWVVTWRRNDHTCILSGAGVQPSVMQTLAAWGGN